MWWRNPQNLDLAKNMLYKCWYDYSFYHRYATSFQIDGGLRGCRHNRYYTRFQVVLWVAFALFIMECVWQLRRGLHYLVNCKDPDYAVFWNSSDSKKWNPDRCGSLKHFECYDFYRQINLSWICFYHLIWNVQRHKFDEWVGRFINSPIYLYFLSFALLSEWCFVLTVGCLRLPERVNAEFWPQLRHCLTSLITTSPLKSPIMLLILAGGVFI